MVNKIDNDGVEYYTPDMGNAKPLKIHEKIEDEDNFETRLDEKVLFERMAKDLYKYPKSSIRELLTNAIGHGARKANETYGEENGAYVKVTLHPYDRKLVIQDVNGMGMTYAKIKSLMSFMGRSGNFDNKTAGQFGMGYFSHMKVSDSCIISTKVRDPYEYNGKIITAISFLNNRGWQWQKISDVEEEIELEAPGTRLELTLNSDITIEETIEQIKLISKYQDIDVKLFLEDEYKIENWSDWNGDEEVLPSGEYEIEQISNLDNILEYAEEGHEDDQEIIELDNDDIYFKAIMERSPVGHLRTDQKKVFLLARVPISIDDGLIPNFTGYVLNIKNERKFAPMPDRERLKKESEQQLTLVLKELFTQYFSKLNATNVGEFQALPMKFPVLYMNSLNISEYFTTGTKSFIESIVEHDVSHISYNKEKITTTYSARHTLHQVLAYKDNALIIHNKSVAPIRAVIDWCNENNIPEKEFIRIDTKTSKVAQSYLNEWKIPLCKDFMKENKIKAKRKSGGSSTGLTMHIGGTYSRTTEKIEDFDDIEYDRTIWIKGPMKPWTEMIFSTPSNFVITKYNKAAVEYGRENDEPIITEASLWGMKSPLLYTNKGIQTMSDWFDENKKAFDRDWHNDLDVFKYDEKLVETRGEDVKRVLSSEASEVNFNYEDEPVKFYNKFMIVEPHGYIHDIDGNEIQYDVFTDYRFLSKVARELNVNSELRDIVIEQITVGDVKYPDYIKETANANDDENITFAEKIYDAMFDKSSDYIDTHKRWKFADRPNIESCDSWKGIELSLGKYFGFEPQLSSYYWNSSDAFNLLLKHKKAIESTWKDKETQQMIIDVIMNTNTSSITNSVQRVCQGMPKPDGAISSNINAFYKKIYEIVDDIKHDETIDTFFSTKHVINKIESIDQGDRPGENYSKDFFYNLIKKLNLVNQSVPIKGHYKKFLEEFIPNADVDVVEEGNSVIVTTRPEDYLQVNIIIMLHSNKSLFAVEPKGDKIRLTYVPHESINAEDAHYYSTETSYLEKCPCGCDNYKKTHLYVPTNYRNGE